MESEKIGKFIAKLRKEKNMTQDELSKELHVDRSMISKWERGLNIPQISFMLELSKLFDVSVNEIYFGERKNVKNKDKINEITINIIKDNKRKIKKIILSGIIIILLLIIPFFTYYFINTYNSISVYKINGENENFKIYNGLIVLSREKSYIQLGPLKNLNNKNINNIRLYYLKDDKENLIFSDSNSTDLFINDFEYYEAYSYNDVKYILKNLYLEVSFEDKKEVIKLTSERDFTNNKLFYKRSKSLTNDEIYKYSINAPKYIQENFKLDKAEEKFYLEEKKENMTIKQSYFYEAKLYIVDEFNNKFSNHFEYFYPDISYFSGDNSIETYSLNEKKCLTKKCDMKKINYFIDNYISKINFEN